MRVEGLGARHRGENGKAYDNRKCDVLTSDVSQLYAERLKLNGAQQPYNPSGSDLKGAARARGAARRRPVVRPRQVDALFADDAKELGVKSARVDNAIKIGKSGHQAAGRYRGRIWRATGPCQRLGGARRPRRRQLQRDL